MRTNCDLVIYVNTAAAMRDGARFFQSTNGVILTQGFTGQLPPRYISEVRILDGGRDYTFSNLALPPPELSACCQRQRRQAPTQAATLRWLRAVTSRSDDDMVGHVSRNEHSALIYLRSWKPWAFAPPCLRERKLVHN